MTVTTGPVHQLPVNTPGPALAPTTPDQEGWRYFCTRLDGNGGEALLAGDLPLSNVTLTHTLSGRDSMDAEIPVEVPGLAGMFTTHRTAVYAELGGVIRWGGLVVDAPMDGPKLTLQAVGMVGYVDGLRYDLDTAYIGDKNADALNIARQFWTHLQTRPGANIGLRLDIDPPSSPVLLGSPSEDVNFQTGSGEDVSFEAGPWKLSWYETTDMGSRWDDLAKDGGFDYYETHSWDAKREHIVHTLHINWPLSGRRRDDLRFAVGENVTQVPVVEADGDEYATEVFVLGAGEGSKACHGVAQVPGATGVYRSQVVTDKALTSNKQCQARAAELAKAYAGDQDIKTLVIDGNHGNAPLGTWGLGDTITVRGDGSGWIGDLTMAVRVLSYSITPDSGDQVTLTVTRSERVS